jgi:acetylornithine deacetylase/succinyl-diaminopimelate desuccinylase-like protein
MRIDAPSITHSLRGMTYIEVEVEGPQGRPAQRAVGRRRAQPGAGVGRDVGQALQPDNTIAVPGFYDDVVALTEAERAMIAKTDLSEEQYKAVTGVPALWGDKRFTIRERLSARPTLDINGLWSGWSGPGPKTIIPQKAGAKLSSRLVAIKTRTRFSRCSRSTWSPSPRRR